jgi:ribonuclease-3 family protein
MLSSASLAFMGDAVFELKVRNHLIRSGKRTSKDLSGSAQTYSSATAQADLLNRLSPLLSEEELEVVRRGKNFKPKHTPKNASLKAYNHATALECLFGYLYLTNRSERLDELFELILIPSPEEL